MPSCQFVTFDVANQFFGVPVSVVQEVLLNEKYTPMPLAPDGCSGLFNLRGEVIGTVDLGVRFGLPSRPMSGAVVNVVVLAGGDPVSLLVDRIGLVVDLDDAAFEPPPDTLTGPTRALVVGTYKTEDRADAGARCRGMREHSPHRCLKDRRPSSRLHPGPR